MNILLVIVLTLLSYAASVLTLMFAMAFRALEDGGSDDRDRYYARFQALKRKSLVAQIYIIYPLELLVAIVAWSAARLRRSQ